MRLMLFIIFSLSSPLIHGDEFEMCKGDCRSKLSSDIQFFGGGVFLGFGAHRPGGYLYNSGKLVNLDVVFLPSFTRFGSRVILSSSYPIGPESTDLYWIDRDNERFLIDNFKSNQKNGYFSSANGFIYRAVFGGLDRFDFSRDEWIDAGFGLSVSSRVFPGEVYYFHGRYYVGAEGVIYGSDDGLVWEDQGVRFPYSEAFHVIRMIGSENALIGYVWGRQEAFVFSDGEWKVFETPVSGIVDALFNGKDFVFLGLDNSIKITSSFSEWRSYEIDVVPEVIYSSLAFDGEVYYVGASYLASVKKSGVYIVASDDLLAWRKVFYEWPFSEAVSGGRVHCKQRECKASGGAERIFNVGGSLD